MQSFLRRYQSGVPLFFSVTLIQGILGLFCFLGHSTEQIEVVRHNVGSAHRVSLFNEVYSESLWLNRSQSLATFASVKAGWRHTWSGVPGFLDSYLVSRFGWDSKTQASALTFRPVVVQDNYVFLGWGVDWVDLLPGIRMTAQMGYSWDLSRQIHREGVDFRLGWQSYHEWKWNTRSEGWFARAQTELYTDGLYYQRYRNVISFAQVQNFVPVWSGESWRLGPVLAGAGAVDNAGLDYNRFVEARAGVRLRWDAAAGRTLIFYPHVIQGWRLGRPTTLPNYQDLRVLLVIAW